VTAVRRAGVWLSAGLASTALAAPPSRGELLYTTHCIACHTAQVHWRDARRATDWSSLRGQVQRWQAVAQLGWSEADVTEVARYPNETIYRFAMPERRAAVDRVTPH
jgi:mono/diheme cytochrome c family protein